MHEFNDFFDLHEVEAKVFLGRDGDSNNVLLVSEEKLMLKNEGKKQVYQLSAIKSLSTGNKKLLLPLLMGAVLAPFSFISYFTNLFHPIFHLVFTLFGILLFFIGWAGKSTLVIRLTSGHEDFIFLSSISKNLNAFVDYINYSLEYRQNREFQHLIYIEKDSSEMQWLYSHESEKDQFPVFGFTFQQVARNPKLWKNIIAVDPSLTGREIKFAFDQRTDMMRPKIDGPIQKKSLIELPAKNLIR